ncbi:hypothetical protein [Moorena sp. SIO4G3]|nr:hypothetical protein [Moorena sp. SIO4G3]
MARHCPPNDESLLPLAFCLLPFGYYRYRNRNTNKQPSVVD